MKRYISSHTDPKHVVMVLVSALILCFLWGCGKRSVSPELAPVAMEDRRYVGAEALFKAGDYEGALAQYQAYVTEYPHRSLADDALMKMASICVLSGRYQDARDLYQRVLYDYPDSVSAVNAPVEILATFYHQGDYSGFFERVGGLDIASLSRTARVRLFKLMGDAYLSSGHAKAAVDAYALSLSYYSEMERPATTPEMTAALGELEVPDIQDLLAGPGYLPKAHLMVQLGRKNMQVGWDQAALEAFDAFLLAYPNHELADEVRGLIESIRQKAAAYDRFSVGCLLPLTGSYSSYGKRALNGVELAFSRFRLNHPEVPIRLVVKDTGSEASQAVQAVRELDEAHVAAILGPIVMATQAAEEAQRMGIPIITLSQKDGVADVGGYVFRNFLTPQSQVNTIVSYLIEDLGLKRFAILYPDEKYGSTFMNLFWDKVIELGGVVTGCEAYKGDATDFADPIKKLVGLYYEMPDQLKTELLDAARPLPDEVWRWLHPRVLQEDYTGKPLWTAEQPFYTDVPVFAGVNIFMLGDASEEFLSGEGDYAADEETEPEAVVDFDAVFIPDSSKKTGLIVPQLAYYDVENVHFVGTNLWHSDELIHMARRYLQNALLTDGFFAESDLPLVREFVDSFQSVYDTQPGFIEAVAFDTADILFDLVSRPEVLFRSTIREKLVSEPVFQGVTGPTTFLETGEAEKQLYLLQIKGERFRAVPSPRTRRQLP